jgi:hypothetical protein
VSLLCHIWAISLGVMGTSWGIVLYSVLLLAVGVTALANTERKT